MPLETIYVARHGFRSSWMVDHATGIYSSSFPTPTGIPADPPLTSHGTRQSEELAQHLIALEPPIEGVFSSPFYRCLQTIEPYVKLRQEQLSGSSRFLIHPEHGIREFFGAAPFSHPEPASSQVLKAMFPAYDETYMSAVKPSSSGETYAQLYERVAKAVNGIVEQCDKEGLKSVILCTHAAVVIILGRILTGIIPDRVEQVDFKAYTCGLSVFRRSEEVPRLHGVATRWICEQNSDCSFLRGGEERGWSFSGDESDPGTGSMSNATEKHKL